MHAAVHVRSSTARTKAESCTARYEKLKGQPRCLPFGSDQHTKRGIHSITCCMKKLTTQEQYSAAMVMQFVVKHVGVDIGNKCKIAW